MGHISEDRPVCGDLICISLGWDLSAGSASDTIQVSWLRVDVGAQVFLRLSWKAAFFVPPECWDYYKYGICRAYFCSALCALCYAGFHSDGGTGCILLVMSFCTHDGECFLCAASSGCWLKPVPYCDTSQGKTIHVWYRPVFTKIYFALSICSNS